MAQSHRERQGLAHKGAPFVTLGSAAPKRTKAGPKLAVPRPVNLPSLKKENAGNEPGAPSSGAVGWSSGGGDAATADALPVDGGAEPSSSLVEKASWAGHGRSAPPAPWEQPRALNLREFPSLAAAAAVPQHPTHTHRGASSTQATFSGAWDEDERGPPRHGHALAGDRGHSRDAAAHDAHQDSTARYRRGMQPTYGRHRGDFSPPRDHRDEAYRHGTTPYQGAYGGWRDDRDWQRHDRFDGPMPRFAHQGPLPPPRDHGRRFGERPHPDDADFHGPIHHRGRHPDAGRVDRSGPYGDEPRDPTLFPPPRRGTEHDTGDRSRSRNLVDVLSKASGVAGRQELQSEQSSQQQPDQHQHQPNLSAPGACASGAQPAQPASVPANEGCGSAVLPPPQRHADAAAGVVQQPPEHHRDAASTGAEHELSSAPGAQQVPGPPAPSGTQANGGSVGLMHDDQPAPPPPPVMPKLSPPPLPARSSVVKPGLSWKALVAGVPAEQPVAATKLQQLGADADGADKLSRRNRGKKQEGRKEAAASTAQQAAGPALSAVATAGKQQRSKRTSRGRKGSGQTPSEDGGQQQLEGDSDATASTGSKGQPEWSKGRGRSNEVGAQPPSSTAAEGEVAGNEAAPNLSQALSLLVEPGPASDSDTSSVVDVVPVRQDLASTSGLGAPVQHTALPLEAASGESASAGAAGAADAAPVMPAAFGWSSPLADEVAKLQLTSSSGSNLATPLGPVASDQLVTSHMALLPTLGRDLRQPGTLLAQQRQQQQQQQAPLPALPASASTPDSMADVITSLPADLTLEDLGTAAPAASGMLTSGHAVADSSSSVMGRPFPSPSPPPPSASPPPFPGGLFPAASSSWQSQPPSKEAVQLFEGTPAAPAFNFGSIVSHHMQFGAVAAAFGQQQQFGPSGGVDWSSPAPSPPPFVGAGLAPTPAFGPSSVAGAGLQYGHPAQLPPASQSAGGPSGVYGALPTPQPIPQRPLNPGQLEDPAAALPDDVFDVPQPQHVLPPHQHGSSHTHVQAPRGRSFPSRSSRARSSRYPQQQQQQQQQPQPQQQPHGGFGQQHSGYPSINGAGLPPHMPGWPSSQAPHFLPPQLVGPRQQQGSSGRGRGRGRTSGGGSRSTAGPSRQTKPAPSQQ